MTQQLSIIIIIITINFAWAQDYSSNNPESILKRSIRKTTIQNSGLDEVVIRESNNTSGVYESLYDTTADKYKYSIGLHFNHNPTAITNILGFELSQSIRNDTGWSNLYGSVNLVDLATISTSFAGKIQQNLLFSAGYGISYRFKLIQSLISSKSVFENLSASLSGNYLSDSINQTTWLGPGLKADYGIHNRTSGGYHLGLKFSYNIASMVSAEEGMVISWLTAALDASFYF